MTPFEDHFSRRADAYARFRPGHPSALFDYLAGPAPGRRLAWDCGTGNGQAALELATRFDRVVATDASAEQLAHAPRHERIEYRVEPAEEVSLEPGRVDLTTVAAAVHWFDLERFYATVRRVSAPGGILAVWSYHLPVIAADIDPAVRYLQSEVLGAYWPERLRYVEQAYRNLPFPFPEVDAPEFETHAQWTLPQFIGFVESWSATQRYHAERGRSAVDLIEPQLAEAWGETGARRLVRWPLFLRVGRVG